MRTFVRVLAVLVLVALVIGIGTAIYNQGVTAGLDEAARVAAASGEPTPVDPSGYRYGYGWGGPYAHGPFGWGFGGFFGLLFGVFAIVLIVGLVRAAFGGWRGGPGPGGWGGSRHDRVEEWHRELHRREGAGDGGPAPA
jgi:hypothetical protein